MSATGLRFAAAVGLIGLSVAAHATPIPLDSLSTEAPPTSQRAVVQARLTEGSTAASRSILRLSADELNPILFTAGHEALLPFRPRVGTVSEPSQAALMALGLGIIGLAMSLGRRRRARRSGANAEATDAT